MTTQSPTLQSIRPVKNRIMRWLGPGILLAFLVVGLVGAGLVWFDASQNFDNVQQLILEDAQRRFENELEVVSDDLRGVSASDVLQEYGALVSQVTAPTADIQTLRDSSLTELNTLLTDSDLPYRAVRFIQSNGTVRLESAQTEQGLTSSTDVQRNVRNPNTDPSLTRGLAAEYGTVTLTDIEIIGGADSQTLFPLLTFTAPIPRLNDINNPLGVIELEMDGTPLFNEIRNAPATSATDAGVRYALLTQDGRLLADSGTSPRLYLPNLNAETVSYPQGDGETFAYINERGGEFISFRRGIGVTTMTAVTAASAPWRLVAITEQLPLLLRTIFLAVFVLVGSLLIGSGVVFYVNRRLSGSLQNIERASDHIQSLARGLRGQDAEQQTLEEDERLVEAAAELERQLATLNAKIETQAQRYDRNLRVAARISRETAMLQDIDDLLTRSLNLISSSFQLYHAQVFLTDNAKMNAVLRYSQGEAGRQMMEKQHKLAVGSESVVGQVTATGNPVIVNDTLEADTHAYNPILPETRAEMALPLQIGDEMLGALDLQSDQVNAFSEEDLETYQLIADQVAIAVYKTRLLRQSEERVQEIEQLNRQLTQMAWEELADEVGLEQSYRYDLLNVETGKAAEQDVYKSNHMLSVPIRVRGEVIGTINATPPENAEFTQNDSMVLQSVAERISLAAENARLFQETQTNLAETSVLYQTSRYLNEADSMTGIVEAIVMSAMPGASSGQVIIFDEYDAEDGPDEMEIIADWSNPNMYEGDINEGDLTGTRFSMSETPILSELFVDQVTIISDIGNDSRLDEEMRGYYMQMGARAAVYIPLTVRGIWQGTVVVQFPEKREFTDREGRIYSNLIDQAGVAIENRLLLRQTEEALMQNERLYASSRIINQAQGMDDLVRAAVATTDVLDLNFGLALFEGELDETGWSTSLRHISQSRNGGIYDPGRIYQITIDEESPLRQRLPVNVSTSNPQNSTQEKLTELIRSNNDSFASVFPLFSTNQPIALFFVSRKTEQPLTPENEEIYRALTGQMSTVIQNRRLLEQTATALDETRRLYDASRAITDAQDMLSVYDAALQHLAPPQPALGRMSILLTGPEYVRDAAYMEVVYSWSRQEREVPPLSVGTRFESGELPFAALAMTSGSETLHIQNLAQKLTDFPALQAFFAVDNTDNLVIGTLESRQNWLGIIMMESRERAVFDEQYVRFVQAVADQIAVALQNQILFEEAQQEARQAIALAEASQLANQIGGELESSINPLFARVAETAGYDRWLLMLLNEPTNQLEVITQHVPEGNAPIAPDVLHLNAADHTIADTVLYNRTLIVNDPLAYPAFQDSQEAADAVGKHIATPIVTGDEIIGSLVVGRSLDEPDLTERDETLITTMAAQVAVTMENQRLFVAAENERTALRSILNTLPAGVLVLDAETLTPVQYNAQITDFIKRDVIDEGLPFSAENYGLFRTGTDVNYPNEELPVNELLETGESSFSDDLSVVNDEGKQIDLLVNAAPIRDTDGKIRSIVAAFEDISNLRSLENTLQDNLRETISLYEATRSLTEAGELDEVLDVVLFQLIMNEPEDAHILLMEGETGELNVARNMNEPIEVEGLSVAVLNAERIVMIDDVQGAASLNETDRVILRNQNIEAIATVPLRSRSREMPLGWIVVNYTQPHEFGSEDERFLSTLGDNAAVAIDNRYLFSSTQQALQETVSLYGATSTISQARTMQDLSAAVQEALESLGPDIYAAFLMTNPSAPDDLVELFNVSLDAAPIQFEDLLTEYSLFRKDPIFIDDLYGLDEPTPFQKSLIDLGNVQSLASVALRVKGEPDGRLFLAYHTPHTFTESETRYLNAIADSASVIVDNVLLLEQIQTALEETSTLYQASRSLADATTAEDILDVVVEKLINEHVGQAFIALLTSESWDTEGATVQVIKSWQDESGIDLEGITLRSDQFPAWNLLSSDNVVTVDDIETDDGLNEMERRGIQSLDTRSLAVIPLRVPKRSIGAVWISSQDAHRHTDREQRVYQAFAEQASLTLEASFLLQQTERRARQLATSTEVSQIASSILDLDELLPRVVNLIREQFGYDHVQVFLMDRDNEYALLRASTGEAGEQLLSVNHKLAKGSQSVIGQVTERAEPVIALDTADANVVHRPNPYLPLTRSEMALPILIKGEVIGALDVQSDEPNAFGDEDVAVLTTLAAQISVAIDNARLFDQAERRADEMSFLFTIATAAASADTLEESLQSVVELLLSSRDEAQAVGIYLINEAETDDDEETLNIVALAGSDQPLSGIEDVRTDDKDNLIGIVSRDLIPMIVEDTETEDRYLPLTPGARSAVVVPMDDAGEVVGAIVLESAIPRVYDQDVLTLLLALKGTLSAIVINARLLQEVEQQRDELVQLDKLKSQFLANMSHELRTPLNSIIGFSRVMLKGIDGELTEMQEQDLTTIYNSGQHLLGLINDILDEAKIAADKMTLETEYFDIRSVVEGVRSIGIGLVKEKPVEMVINVVNNLPDAYGDEFRTRQVLLNLVSNAAKFTNEGSVAMSVYTVEDEEFGTMLRVDVEDTGIGIAEEDLPMLFEAFRQVDSSLTRSAEGTGLGLRIAKSLVELQGGEMFVDSELDMGSTFSITVPTEPVEVDVDEIEGGVVDEETDAPAVSLVPDEDGPGSSPANGTEASTSNGKEGQPDSKKKKKRETQSNKPPSGIFRQKRQILLIEDDTRMVDQYRRLLQREGFEVQVASDAFYAQTMASGLRPTLVLMDVDFADGAGWDVLKDLKDRDDTFDIPVLVVTMNEDSERAYQLGAYKYLQRPAQPKELMEAVLSAEEDSNVDRVLIIDDQPQSTRLLEQILQEHGKYRVFSAQGGQEGIALVARRHPDLIVLDLRMPEMDGFAVLEDLKSRPETAEIPVLIVTGESELEPDEREKLTNLEVIYKTDLNQENYQAFIDEVRRQIADYQGE